MKIKEGWHLPDHKQAARRDKEQVPYIDVFSLTHQQQQLGAGKTYYISTYGCQANERDSETLRGILESMGFADNQKPEGADVILMNTCGIRENASNNVLGEIGSYKKLYRENKDLVIGICGCMSQEEGFVTTLLEKYPQVRLLFGTHNISDLPHMMEKAMDGQRVVEIYSRQGEVYENLPSRRYQKHKAWVNIMYGCDKFCTYCIVPYTRGKQRSRTMANILEEVKTLKKLGYQEITLLGQNVNAYGKDLDEGVDFAALLEEVAKTGIPRIRFMTSHPWDFSLQMIDIIAKYDNIMPYIHLPMQSGDDEILRRMGRRYSKEDYLKLFDAIKEKIPNAAISTDIIVGFPNESDEAFEHTLDVVRYCKFDNAFTFIYSPRPQTPAARMEDPIDLDVKKERLLRLNKIWNDLALEKNKELVGQVVPVLVDGPSRKDPNVFCGYSDTNKLVNFKAEGLEQGMMVNVRIDEAHTFSLNGTLISVYNNPND
ncbi:MAG: tRNA (N6-isopentenyl adenosine(37)-C2)-methylthiotransferase MiaB [Ileibacterium sp.]|nr:tRNA (N6-isopentenyl adenosine(37)-C2)-methylthiotransferase MiaB [Ileibacterium sp.]